MPFELRLLVCSRGGGTALPPPADDPGQDREENHDQHHDLDVLVDSGNISSEEIPGEQHAPYPEDRSDDADDQELAVRHPAHAGHHRGERPDDWHELRED